MNVMKLTKVRQTFFGLEGQQGHDGQVSVEGEGQVHIVFCLCSRWQGLCSTGLAATGGLEAGEEHLLPSAKVIFCHHDDGDDIDDMDGDDDDDDGC